MIETFRTLRSLVWAPRLRLAQSVLLGALAALFGVGLMATAGYLISRAAEQPAILSLTVAIVGVRFFGLARPVTRYLERLTSHDVAFRTLGRVRVRAYERIEPLVPAELRGYRRGDLLSRIVADVDSLQNVHLRGLAPLFVALLAGGVSVVVAAWFLTAAGLVLAAGLLVGVVLVPGLAASVAWRSGERQSELHGHLTAELVELMCGAPEIALYGQEDARLHRLSQLDGKLVRSAKRAALADGLADGLRLVVTGATVAGVLAVSVDAHSEGRLDRVLIAMLALLALASFEVVQPLAQAARALSETLAAGRRVLDLTVRDSAVQDPAQPVPLPPGPVAVALEDVRARYMPEEPPALDGVSLRLEPGRRVALVGPSGAGKTTVTNLLLRFLDPEEGRVTLGARDLREYRQEDVRQAIAVAGQDAHLFSTSIRDNVRLGRPIATDQEVEAALRRSGLWEWVGGLPHGLDTEVGEVGRELSGGQRQRLVLARALLVEAPILVLDEPTAHLDSPTAETLIKDVLAAACKSTVLLITHRPEGLDLVDEVVYLEAGRIRSDLTSSPAPISYTRDGH